MESSNRHSPPPSLAVIVLPFGSLWAGSECTLSVGIGSPLFGNSTMDTMAVAGTAAFVALVDRIQLLECSTVLGTLHQIGFEGLVAPVVMMQIAAEERSRHQIQFVGD